MTAETSFIEHAAAVLADVRDIRGSVTDATIAFDARRRSAWSEIDVERWRDWASAVKDHALRHLDHYLEEAERRFRENGVDVHWAEDAVQAWAVVDRIVRRYDVRTCVKAKSMLTEELGLTPLLERAGVTVFETDLGEYILQLLDDTPSHIVGPAIHCSLTDVRELFAERLGTPPDADPDVLARAARTVLRQAFQEAELGVSGGNFVIAETGTLVLIENEGNIRLTTSLPPVHIALVGIEKILPRWTDAGPFIELTSRSATGQPAGRFVSALQGPRRPGEPTGPDEMHVIFVDNGRTRALADPRAWEALKCVRCGACLNTCPVYRQTGGHPWGWAYSGPIGSVLAPAVMGLERGGHLPWASTLCGDCADACPVRIPIPDLLLYWRQRLVEAGRAPAVEALGLRAFTAAATRPALFRRAERLVSDRAVSVARRVLPVVRAWEEGRAPLRPAGAGTEDVL